MRSWPDLPPLRSVCLSASVLSEQDAVIVVTDHGGLTATAETYMKAAGKKVFSFASSESEAPWF